MIKISEALNSDKELIFLDRSLGTDKNVFEKMLYDDNILSEYISYAFTIIKNVSTKTMQHCEPILKS